MLVKIRRGLWPVLSSTATGAVRQPRKAMARKRVSDRLVGPERRNEPLT